ncbi:MAG: serine hydrolase [Bacteroidota bacterium]
MKAGATFLLLSLFFTTFSSEAQRCQKEASVLDEYIRTSIKDWNSPGLAVAVVKNGKVVFTGSYGVQSIDSNKPIDNHTLFACASTTKAFTAAALGILVDERKLFWDDKVIKHIPGFQLCDPYVTRELTIRDLLTHRCGIGNTDYMWGWMTISGDSALHKIREVQPSYSLRSSFIYQNLMYLAAGVVIENVSGKTWQEFMKERIFIPLDMTETYALYQNVKDKSNLASAHLYYENEIVQIDHISADAIAPAGAMWSSISDMAKWMQFLTNNGVVKGDTLIKLSTFNELFKPQQIVPSYEFYATQEIVKPKWTTYGLGWFQHDYNGNMVQVHTGSLPGMVAIAGLIREYNVGVYVMGNLDHNEIRHVILYAAFDLFTTKELSRDWNKELKALYTRRSDSHDEHNHEPVRLPDTKPTVPNEAIIGKYNHHHYGLIEVSKKDGRLRFNLNNTVKGTMTHWHYDTYQVIFDEQWYGKVMVSFRKNGEPIIKYLETFGVRFDYTKSL